MMTISMRVKFIEFITQRARHEVRNWVIGFEGEKCRRLEGGGRWFGGKGALARAQRN